MKGGGWRAIMVALSPIDPTTVCVGDEATNYCCCAGLRGVFLSASVPRASEGAGTRTGLACLRLLHACDTYRARYDAY